MPRSVNAPTYRQMQAQQTKDRIADAARRLFAGQGYRSTSIDAIAAEAGVAVRTVYTAFGAKREILSMICEKWLADANAIALGAEARAQPSAEARLRAAAHWLRVLYEKGFDVVTVFEAASDEDTETREMLRSKLNGRNHVMDAIIASLDGKLTKSTRDAQAVYRALAAPGVYRELVIETGWSPQEFEDWVAEALLRQLL